jgi:hypothetical protein
MSKFRVMVIANNPLIQKKCGDQKNEMNTNPTILDQMFITTTHSSKISQRSVKICNMPL